MLRADGPVAEDQRFAESNGAVLDERHDQFARAMALEGDVLAVAGTRVTRGVGLGLRVFERGAGGWQLAAAFEPLDADFLGCAIAMEGGRIAATAHTFTSAPTNARGAVIVYAREGGEWREQQRWVHDAADDAGWFGASVAWTANGLAVGCPSREASGHGNVYFLDGEGEAFGVTEILRGPRAANSFGWDLASRGDTLAVGAPYASHGAVFAYRIADGRLEECGAWRAPGPARCTGTTMVFAGDRLVVGRSLPPCPCPQGDCRCFAGAHEPSELGLALGDRPVRPPPLVDTDAPLSPVLLHID